MCEHPKRRLNVVVVLFGPTVLLNKCGSRKIVTRALILLTFCIVLKGNFIKDNNIGTI